MDGNNYASALRDALETVVRQCGDRLTEASGNTALLPHIRALLAVEGGPEANLAPTLNRDGWRLVPPEATPAMVKAWQDVPIVVPPGTSDEDADAIAANLNWKAMLAAAPTCGVQEDGK